MSRFKIEKVKKIFEKGGCILLAKKYTHNFIPLQYKCSCKNISKISLANFQLGKRCYQCRGQKISESKKLSYEEVKERFKTYGFELLDFVYKGVKYKYLCKCSCGNIKNKLLCNAKRGDKCGCGLLKGNKHPHWNFALTDKERNRKRSYPGYCHWREAVLKKDNYVCQNCDNGNKLTAHHIESHNNNPELRTQVLNGITLCETCHADFHHLYGYGNNTKKELNEFLIKKE